eukprot:7175850-Pyramimonas_sp.AAC.1
MRKALDKKPTCAKHNGYIVYRIDPLQVHLMRHTLQVPAEAWDHIGTWLLEALQERGDCFKMVGGGFGSLADVRRYFSRAVEKHDAHPDLIHAKWDGHMAREIVSCRWNCAWVTPITART